MKFVLIFLSAYVVAISHQQFQQRPRSLLWWSPYYEPLPVDREDYIPFYRQLMRRPSRPSPYFTQDVYYNSNLTELFNEPNQVAVNDGFPDAQSRTKSSNHFLQDSFYKQQAHPRFLYNFGSASFYNPFFKTATFTLTSTLNMLSIQNCVPAFQVPVMPVACRRKRHDEIQDFTGEQFSIVPSETLKLMPTELAPPSSVRNTEEISSSKGDYIDYGETSTTDQHLRAKRFFFINKNQFVVSSTVTSYSFFSKTSTVTVNLINPPPAVQCAAEADGNGNGNGNGKPRVEKCVACLPAGFIVCPRVEG